MSEPLPQTNPTAANDSGVRETVLVAHGKALVRSELAAYLRECGYRVAEASSADEALVVLRSATLVDIVLSDVDLAGEMDGFGLASWIRANRPEVQVTLSGTPAKSAEAAANLCEQGPDRAVPYDHKFLADRIRHLLAARRGASRI
jgi:CheY-like chemotaxis protein